MAKIVLGNNYPISKEKIVKVIEYQSSGEIEIVDLSNNNSKGAFGSMIKKLNDNEYLNLNTGKICSFTKRKKKIRNNIRKSMKIACIYCENNFSGKPNELFVTLTFSYEVDSKKAKKEFRSFIKKLRKIESDLEYIAVIEKKENYHFHILIKKVGANSLYIDNKDISKLWGNGYTKTNRITKRKNSLKEIEEEKKERQDSNEVLPIDKVIGYMTKLEGKKDIPVEERLFIKSKGLLFPEPYDVSYGSIRPELNKRYYRRKEDTYLITNLNEDVILQKVKKERWKKRKEK